MTLDVGVKKQNKIGGGGVKVGEGRLNDRSFVLGQPHVIVGRIISFFLGAILRIIATRRGGGRTRHFGEDTTKRHPVSSVKKKKKSIMSSLAGRRRSKKMMVCAQDRFLTWAMWLTNEPTQCNVGNLGSDVQGVAESGPTPSLCRCCCRDLAWIPRLSMSDNSGSLPPLRPTPCVKSSDKRWERAKQQG